jgi:hypothetical protein
MPVITASALAGRNLKGVEHGATISLILDHSEPGHGPGCTATPTTRPGSSTKEISPSSSETSVTKPGRATSSSPRRASRTSSSTTAPVRPTSSAFTPTQKWSPNGSNECRFRPFAFV